MIAPTVIDSFVDHVLVFRSGAVVTRQARLQAEWPERVVLEHLPLSLDDGSVRARVVGGEEGALPQPTELQVEIDVPPLGQPVEPPSQQEVRQAEQEVGRLQWTIQRLEQACENCGRLNFQLPAQLDKEAPRHAPSAAWRAASVWVQQENGDRWQQVGQQKIQLRQAQEKLARLRRQAEQARADRGVDEEAVSKRVVVKLQPGRHTAASLQLEYRVQGACWRPSYELRVGRDGQQASLGLRALVTQNSGEPWDRCQLSVSTADLLREITLPELKSLRIGRQQAEPAKRAWREPPTGSEGLFESLDAALSSLPGPDTTVPPMGDAVLANALLREETELKKPPQKPSRKEFKRRAKKSPRRREAPPPPPPAPCAAPEAPGSIMLSADMEEECLDDMEMMPEECAKAGSMAPPAMERSVMAKRSSGLLGGLVSRASAAFDGTSEAQFGGGGFEEATPVGQSAPAGSGHRLVVEQVMVNYSRLQLVGWSDSNYTRGSLRQLELGDLLSDLSEQQAQRVGYLIGEAESQAYQVASFPEQTVDIGSSSGAYDYRYNAKGRVDVPADGKLHSVPLYTKEAEISLTLVVVPRESDQAVRVAAMKNPLGAPLLAGPADIYLDSEFLVSSSLDTVPAGAEMKVGLGVEEACKVARNSHYKEETQGLLGGGLALKHEVEIEVASRLSSPVLLEVRERIPIKDEDDKDIIVQEDKVSPPWELWRQSKLDPLKGGRRWRLKLGPAESQKLSYSYTVHIDSKNELVGGNRRERA